MQHHTEIAVIGGGVGGVAGALAALRAGRRVVLAEESAWLGGQLTNQMVLGLAVPHLVVAMNILLSRQYFAGMPTELGEAARIDGAGEWRIFFTIYLPLARPLVAVVAIFAFTAVWDDFLWPLVTTTAREVYTVQLALVQFATSTEIRYAALMAGALIITLPVLIVFLFNQRAFISGLADGGLTG